MGNDNKNQITLFGPDFPFAYDNWLTHPDGLATIPEHALGSRVAIVGAGVSGLVAAHELMKLGLQPVVYEAGRLGGRLRSQPFPNANGTIAELGGMRFPQSGSSFYHYVNKLGLQTKPFPNPLSEAAGSTVIDLAGQSVFATTPDDLPTLYKDVSDAWTEALETEVHFSALHEAIKTRDTEKIKALWNPVVHEWDDRTFYDFLANAPSFKKLSFRHKEVFGQVGFGTGGWDSDFRNTMLEILRVVLTGCDDDQHLIVGGAEQVPRQLWNLSCKNLPHWQSNISLHDLHDGVPKPGVKRISRADPTANNAKFKNNKHLNSGPIEIEDIYGNTELYDAVLVTCQSWLLTTSIATDESLFSQEHWMALDRTSYMQSSKTFVMVDRPFWKDINPKTNRPFMSMTLTDRLTRGTYLFDNGDNNPGVICLSYSWMADALKMLPLPVEKRVELALDALEKIYPDTNIRQHIVGQPQTISWEADENFLGAFKGALPGHYRYNRRMYTHFMQKELPPAEQGIFIAGDDVSWTPGWAEGAVQTALNAVWGICNHFGGHCSQQNPGPGDCFDTLKPVNLDP